MMAFLDSKALELSAVSERVSINGYPLTYPILALESLSRKIAIDLQLIFSDFVRCLWMYRYNIFEALGTWIMAAHLSLITKMVKERFKSVN